MNWRDWLIVALVASAALSLQACSIKPSGPIVIGDSEEETPVYLCPVGQTCEIDETRVGITKGYWLRIMKAFNRCIDQETR